jgi:protein-L-isoaspartate O-methyltransferase
VGQLRLQLQAFLDPLVRRVNTVAFWYGSAFFDLRYLREDPWGLRESAYEAERHEALIATVPRERPCRVLEVGCGEGVFTARLAEARPRLARLVGVEVSRRAVQRARRRCAPFEAVDILHADVSRGVPVNSFDVIFCVEVLPFLGAASQVTRVAAALAGQLLPGGALVACHGAAEATRVHGAVRAGTPRLAASACVGGHPRRWELAVFRAPP